MSWQIDGLEGRTSSAPKNLSEILKALRHTVLGDAAAGRDSTFAPLPSDMSETFLAEMRIRRERLKYLITLIDEQVRAETQRRAYSRPRCRRPSSRATETADHCF